MDLFESCLRGWWQNQPWSRRGLHVPAAGLLPGLLVPCTGGLQAPPGHTQEHASSGLC